MPDVTSGSGVRVETVSASACTVPTPEPEADGTLAWDSTSLVLVEVTAGGHTGLGFTYAPPGTARLVDDLLADVVRDADALAPRATHEHMARRIRNAGRGGTAMMALSAVDIALWDLAARLHGLPLTRLWGGACDAGVPVYGSGGFTTEDGDRLRATLRGWTDLGLTAVKIKIGESWGSAVRHDLARTALARETVGDDVALFVDANGGYRTAQACRVGRALDDLGVTWFEEPVSSDDPAGLARVRDAVAADVAAGEYAADAMTLARLAPVVDCLQADVTRCGGYTGWLRATELAAGLQVDLSGHCAPYLTLPAAAVAPRVRHLEWFADHVRIEQLLFEGTPDPVDSALPPSTGPGHGLTLRRAEFERFRVC